MLTSGNVKTFTSSGCSAVTVNTSGRVTLTKPLTSTAGKLAIVNSFPMLTSGNVKTFTSSGCSAVTVNTSGSVTLTKPLTSTAGKLDTMTGLTIDTEATPVISIDCAPLISIAGKELTLTLSGVVVSTPSTPVTANAPSKTSIG